ncbi:hypothetical protein [Methylobacterium sp. E-066]|uniref:hypothetical protein n=1 Tax=Methylobacterium sp. E-066 TaxID=2836584 RepID=UPI001FBA77C2|nr:hypothetical protein [Methylobacterium sp. E-066]MCJ2138733.1 hypothetical protein [Methylobacterium sp. E-066]
MVDAIDGNAPFSAVEPDVKDYGVQKQPVETHRLHPVQGPAFAINTADAAQWDLRWH